MSVQDYMSALKLGKREYNACVNKGKYPYLPVMESMMDEEQIDSEVMSWNRPDTFKACCWYMYSRQN